MSGLLIEITTLPGFGDLFLDPAREVLNGIYEFFGRTPPKDEDNMVVVWGPYLASTADSFGLETRTALGSARNVRLVSMSQTAQRFRIHIAVLWNLCEHLNIKYPKNEIQKFLMNNTAEINEDHREHAYAMRLKQDHKALDRIRMLAFKADNLMPGLKHHRIHSLWSVMSMEVGILERLAEVNLN